MTIAGLIAIIRQKLHVLENFSISVKNKILYIDIFRKGYLKSISKLLEKFVKFERKIEIIPPKNIEKITQFAGSGTAIIGHQGIWASKMAFQGLKLRYPNTSASILDKDVKFLIVC